MTLRTKTLTIPLAEVSRAAAKAAFIEGKPVWFCPEKLQPTKDWVRGLIMYSQHSHPDWDFEGAVAQWHRYNANPEDGMHPSFWLQLEVAEPYRKSFPLLSVFYVTEVSGLCLEIIDPWPQPHRVILVEPDVLAGLLELRRRGNAVGMQDESDLESLAVYLKKHRLIPPGAALRKAESFDCPERIPNKAAADSAIASDPAREAGAE